MDQAQSLRKSIEEYRRKKQDKEEKYTRVIVVASGKGGVGKTNFSVNLAIALTQMGKNVVVLDADLGLANVDVIIGVVPKYNLYDVIFNNKELDEIIINGPSGIKVIPGGSGIESLSNLNDDQRKRLSDKFSRLKDTDVLIIDTGAGISRNVLGFIAVSDDAIVVTTPEPTAITDAYSLIKLANKYVPRCKMNIVINKAMDIRQADTAYQRLGGAVKNFLGKEVPYLGYVIEDTKVKRAVMEQSPFRYEYPDCPASRCVDTIAASLLGLETVTSRAGIKGFFNKLSYLFSKED